MVRVTFLGTGSAFANGRQSNIALLVEKDPVHLLIECGPPILYQLAQSGTSPERITHLFISHQHGDHILGVPMFLLMRAESGSQKPLFIYGNAQTIQVAQTLVQLTFPSLIRRLGSVEWAISSDDQAHQHEVTDDVRLVTQPVIHAPETPVLAVRIEFDNPPTSLVYTGDTAFTEKIVSLAYKCNLLVHETNFSEILQPHVQAAQYGHSTARQAGRTAAQAGCRMLALVHLNPQYWGQEEVLRAEAAQEFTGPVVVPSDGTTLFV